MTSERQTFTPVPGWVFGLIAGTGAYTLLVILWGALVRITGSGAGCGQHWPTCHGEVMPLAPTFETVIEFTHRTTSGLCLLAVMIAAMCSIATTSKGHPIRRPAALSMLFIVTEALIGAAIVLLEYVAENESYWRAAWMALHLVNTFMLTFALGAMGWYARSPIRARVASLGRLRPAFITLVAAVLVTSMAGAVSALGQTLFPALPEQTLMEHVTQDPYANTPYPMLLRLMHPVIALTVSAGLAWFANAARHRLSTPWMRRWADMLLISVGAEVVAGFVNVGLSAPGWMQLVHLALANAVWLSLWATCAAVATQSVMSREAA
jgi:heme A synthase